MADRLRRQQERQPEPAVVSVVAHMLAAEHTTTMAAAEHIAAVVQRYQTCGASAMLLDAWHPTLKGGTGHAFDWTKFPKLDIPLILAGGLTPDNVTHAIEITRAYAVDVSGGVESAKGIKDRQLIEHFMQGVHRGSAK